MPELLPFDMQPPNLGRILITGASGFIGSHLTEICLGWGYEVAGFVRYNSASNYPWIDSLRDNSRFQLFRGDIRDLDSVSQAAEGCNTILHLAALIGIPYSYESPLAYIRTNIEGTYNVLRAARMWKCKNILVTSTSETYGSAQYVPIDERHPAVGQSPYAATKIAADQLALSFYRSFELPVKVVRPFNTYGPRQSARAIIPTIISQILAGRTSLSLGSTTPTRDLTYVDDTVGGFLAVAGSDACVGEAVNLGTQSEISIGDLALRIAHLMGVSVTLSTDLGRLRPKSSEVDRLVSDNQKVRQLTSWRPRYSLDEGLQASIEWMRSHRDYFNPQLYTT